MTATLKTKELLDAVNMAGKFSVGHAFKNICIDLTGRKSVRAFSTIAACEISLPSLDGECEAFEIEAKALAKVIGKSKSHLLTLDVTDNYWLTITDNFGAVFNIVAVPDSDLPVVERMILPSHEFNIGRSHIDSALIYKNNIDDRRPHVTVVNFAGGKVLSTNGDTLYCGNCSDIPMDINIKIKKAVFDRISKKGHIPVAYHSDSNTFEISYGNIRIAGECVDCKFPDVDDLIEYNNNEYYSITINPNDLKYAIDQTFGFIAPEYKGAVFNFFGNKLSISATNPMIGELSKFDVVYKYDVPIDNIETAFNGDYVLKAIACAKKKDDVIYMAIKDNQSPAYFEYEGNKTIVMPMMI